MDGVQGRGAFNSTLRRESITDHFCSALSRQSPKTTVGCSEPGAPPDAIQDAGNPEACELQAHHFNVGKAIAAELFDNFASVIRIGDDQQVGICGAPEKRCLVLDLDF